MLNDLLPDQHDLPKLVIQGITDDSRMVEQGDLFIAVPGMTVDGRDFIKDVEARNAAGVLCESPAPQVEISIPVVAIENLKTRTGDIAGRYYGNPSSQLLVVAITGTNGKTSCSHFVSQGLSIMGARCGVIGTMGYGTLTDTNGDLASNEHPWSLKTTSPAAGLTTPGPINLQKHLAYLVNDSCTAVALEASSHGLEQGRLNGTQIDVAVFTNMTRDHLDYHKDFEGYQKSKQKLFAWEGLKTAIVNRDDEFGQKLCQSISDGVEVFSTSISGSEADIYCRDIHLDNDGLSFGVSSPWGEATIKSPLMGRFNAHNLLSTLAVLGSQGYAFDETIRAISNIGMVKGRMEVIRNAYQPTVVIDYAHTPDALEKALQATREHCGGELWCVFGCGGDRDKGKRPQMGEIASQVASHVMITDDNPRSESSMVIANDIFKGVVPGADVEIETNRRAAIWKVLSKADPGDVVLIAGKGHEEYQEVLGKKLAFSDHEVVRGFVSKSISSS
ncbi:MAG: UDP-N-acetylmuramoyl-L-alanyl-D-glutamate--2,6-diaminopimelate ligase [Gammaproteobacteria bacterium]|nr:UDP-N-acetylmuramoyl-L-alanyl-D-glutamate--2,6-diaminopimelate ligase [Gammaproteobacteria bacterium]